MSVYQAFDIMDGKQKRPHEKRVTINVMTEDGAVCKHRVKLFNYSVPEKPPFESDEWSPIVFNHILHGPTELNLWYENNYHVPEGDEGNDLLTQFTEQRLSDNRVRTLKDLVEQVKEARLDVINPRARLQPILAAAKINLSDKKKQNFAALNDRVDGIDKKHDRGLAEVKAKADKDYYVLSTRQGEQMYQQVLSNLKIRRLQKENAGLRRDVDILMNERAHAGARGYPGEVGQRVSSGAPRRSARLSNAVTPFRNNVTPSAALANVTASTVNGPNTTSTTKMKFAQAELTAVKEYTQDSSTINKLLRYLALGKEVDFLTPKEVKRFMDTINNLKSLLRKLPPSRCTVRRGYNRAGTKLKDICDRFDQANDDELMVLFSDPGFLSTSRKESTSFDGEYLLVITGETGRDITMFSEYSDEFEVLFLPGTEFRISLVVPSLDGKPREIHMHEVVSSDF